MRDRLKLNAHSLTLRIWDTRTEHARPLITSALGRAGSGLSEPAGLVALLKQQLANWSR